MAAGGLTQSIVTGTYTGTGAAVAVSVGFKPKYIRIWNITDGDFAGEYTDTLPDAAALKVVDSGAGTTDLTYVTSNGITLTTRGFSVGTDAALNENAKVYHYAAFR